MDVLLHAAIKERDRLKKLYEASNIPEPIDFTQQTGAPVGITTDLNIAASSGPVFDDDAASTISAGWNNQIGSLTTPRDNGFKVCTAVADMGQWRCGANCVFVVPANVERVLFQSWGPGGGTAAHCCCGGSPHGANGAYTAVEVDVTAGQSYTLVSGCAYCCYAQQTTPGIQGSSTFVCGPNACIETIGGVSCSDAWAEAVGIEYVHNGDQMPDIEKNNCSPTWCQSRWDFCYDSTNDSFCMPFAYGKETWVVDTLGGTNPIFYGIPTMYPQVRLGSDFSDTTGYSEPAPVYGFDGCGCKFYWGGSTCFGCVQRACQGFGQYPGRGGSAGKTLGGCNGCGGDSGRMGMVCVSWNTV